MRENHPKSNAAGRETRTVILECARKLYTQTGSDRVPLRAVAREAGISVGNLTYHFPTKAHLTAALTGPGMPEDLPPEAVTDLRQLDRLLSDLLSSLRASAFRTPDDLAVGRIYRRWNRAIDELTARGYFDPRFWGKVRRDVLGILFLACLAWPRDSALSFSAPALADALWTVLSPWLTPRGREALRILRGEEETL